MISPEDWDRIRELPIDEAHYEIQKFALMAWDLRVEAAVARVVQMYRLARRLNLPAPIISASMALEVSCVMTHHGTDWRLRDRDGREWRPSSGTAAWAERWAATRPGWSVVWVAVEWEAAS